MLPSYPGYKQRQRILLEDLQQHQPRLVIVTAPLFAELHALLRRDYRLICNLNRDRLLVYMSKRDQLADPPEAIEWLWQPSEPQRINEARKLLAEYRAK